MAATSPATADNVTLPQPLSEINVALRKPVKVSSALIDGAPHHLNDGDLGTLWNSGGREPAWIRLDLGAPTVITKVRLHVAQSPDGPSVHELQFGDADERYRTVHVFWAYTEDGQTLEYALPTSQVVQFIRVTTTHSPSWVAWREIEVVGWPSSVTERTLHDLRVWNFSAGEIDNSAWTAGTKHILNPRVEDGRLVGDITGNDPYLRSPPNLRLLAEKIHWVELRMRISAGTRGELFWITSSDPRWSQNQKQTFALVADDQWHTYRVEMRHSRRLMGFVTQFRIDPNTGGGGRFEIERVRIATRHGGSANNLRYTGYYQAHDPYLGMHMREIAGQSNLIHLYWREQEDFRSAVALASELRLKVVPELSDLFFFYPEEQWDEQLQSLKRAVSGLEGSLLCMYLMDEPWESPWIVDLAGQERAIALAKSYFPDLPMLITYIGTRSPHAIAPSLDWIAFDSYERKDLREAAERYDGFGKPLIFVGKAFTWSDSDEDEQTLLHFADRTFYVARDYPEIVGLWWFTYHDAPEQGILGARGYPRVLARHGDIARLIIGGRNGYP